MEEGWWCGSKDLDLCKAFSTHMKNSGFCAATVKVWCQLCEEELQNQKKSTEILIAGCCCL